MKRSETKTGSKATLKIYLVSRTDEIGWDEYVAAVVVAESEEQALTLNPMHPIEDDDWPKYPKTVRLVGSTDKYAKPTIILSSFNAG